MRTFVGVDALEPPGVGTAITIGTFDGVHLGHRALIARTIAAAREREIEAAVVTWDRHPAATLRPDAMPPLLSTPERKIELLSARGADILAVLPFDKELSKWPPEKFVGDVLVKGLGAKLIAVGEDWRFGHKAAGDVTLLASMGQDLGFEVDGVSLEALGEEPITSSRVRRTVASGDVELAHRLLGRPFDLDGRVVHGDHRGKELGFPTANVDLPFELAHPAQGVYAGRARVRDVWYVAATNVGVNPTFGGTAPLRVESYLLDFAEEIYDEPIRIEFWARLRDELKFPTAGALIEQMHADVAATRQIVERGL
ncbi:MAG: bifunctional riboflavin kinase/FAD synthetase [Actinomycetota bacterium]